jgi:hypothetical protein
MLIKYPRALYKNFSFLRACWCTAMGKKILVHCYERATGMLLIFPDIFSTLMCKNAVLILSVYPSKIENKPVKIEQLFLLSYNFTYVASIKYSTSHMQIFKKI